MKLFKILLEIKIKIELLYIPQIQQVYHLANAYTIYNQQNNHAYLQSQIFSIDWTFIYTPNPTSLFSC
jgi:hypothetical protein